MEKLRETKLLDNLEELKVVRENFIENIEAWHEKIIEVYKAIKTDPYSKKTFELSTCLLNLEERVDNNYQEIIEKGALMTSQSIICRIITMYESYFKIYNHSQKNQEKLAETTKKLEQLYGKDKRNILDYDKFVLDCRKKIFDDINSWEPDSKTLDIIKYNINQHFALYNNYLHKYNYNFLSEDYETVNAPRFAYFDINDCFAEVKDKIYKHMYLLFNDYYTNFEMRKSKLTKEDKDKYEEELEIINSIPILKDEYEKYKSMCRNGKVDETSSLKDFISDKELGKSKVLTYKTK